MPKHGNPKIENSVLPMEIDELLLRRSFVIKDFIEIQKVLKRYSELIGANPEEVYLDNCIEHFTDTDLVYSKSKAALEAAELKRQAELSTLPLNERIEAAGATISFLKG